MDLAATSDLLVLSESSFSTLAHAMQPKKKAFTLQSTYDSRSKAGRKQYDLPGTIRGNEEKDGSIKITEHAFLEPVHVE